MSGDARASDQAYALLEGAIDIHVHAGPDPYTARRLDARQLAEAAQSRRMGGLVLKSHEYCTQPLAWVPAPISPSCGSAAAWRSITAAGAQPGGAPNCTATRCESGLDADLRRHPLAEPSPRPFLRRR